MVTKTRAALVASALALVAAPAAQAHKTTWYWSWASAEAKLTHSKWGLQYDVFLVSCDGTGNTIWSDGPRRQRLYRHFDCIVTRNDLSKFYLSFHVLGRDRWTVTY